MNKRMQQEIEEMKRTARIISKPGSALTVTIFKMPKRIRDGISQSLKYGTDVQFMGKR
jgi:hypothetical protein